MTKILVAGCGTEVGKTIVSAILTTLFKGDYWKPVQSGKDQGFDSEVIKNLIDLKEHTVHPSAYSFEAPVSPHYAAQLEGKEIDIHSIVLPKTRKPLIIESVGGVLVPLTLNCLSIDLFKTWGVPWVVVSRHYVGSINHTLLTMNVLRNYGQKVAGLVFNGEENPSSEEVILHNSKVPFLGRLKHENEMTLKTVQEYAATWKENAFKIFK